MFALPRQAMRPMSAALKGQTMRVAAARLYHPKVIEHYTNPRNVGSLDKNLPNVGTGLVGAPACGDVMKPVSYSHLDVYKRQS